MTPDPRERPAVSVVVPFIGGAVEAAEAVRSVAAIEHRRGDEIIVVDNSVEGAALRFDGTDGVQVVAATVMGSAYAARNEGVELATADWVLFVDADCRPRRTILDDYFAQPIDSRCGAVGGEVVGAPDQRSVAARWARSRRLMSSEENRRFSHLPFAPTANLLVRRTAHAEIGGFPEGMTAAGGDIYLCWRLQEAGWRLCFCPDAIVEHRHRETVTALLRQTARDAAGVAWLNRVYGPKVPQANLFRGVTRSLAGAVGFALTGQLGRSRLKLLDGLVVIAQAIGYRLGHRASTEFARPAGVPVMVASKFPRKGSEAHGRLRRLQAPTGVIVEAAGRAERPDWKSTRGIDVRFWEDEGALASFRDAAWLLVRHPRRVVADHLIAARRGDGRLPLRRLAPAARRLAAASTAPLAADDDAEAAELCRRLELLSGRTPSDDRGAVTNCPA